jgi:adenylosuccinate synthase
MDLPLLRYAGMINGIDWLVVTKLDVLDELAEIPVCVSYKIDGKHTMDAPAQASGYDKIEAVYRNFPGWKTPTEGITKFDKLPRQTKEYLAFLEKETGAKIGMLSTGPDRGHTIFMDEFVSELKTAARKA